jgi:hypothetical protein
MKKEAPVAINEGRVSIKGTDFNCRVENGKMLCESIDGEVRLCPPEDGFFYRTAYLQLTNGHD